MQRIFVIDIGSNSIRMMDAQVRAGEILSCHKQLITARLGEKAPGTTAFTAEAVRRGSEAVAALVSCAREADPSAPIYAFATSAVRDAENRDQLLEAVYAACGIRVEVLSGQQEAAVGAAGALQQQDGCMLDIGGSSTEVVVKKGGKLTFAHSFDIGCVRAKNLFPNEADPAVYRWAKAAFLAKRPPKGGITVAIGGTPTSLAAAVLGLAEYDPAAVDGCVLERAALEQLYGEMLPLSPGQRAQRWCLDARRAEIILYGIAVITAYMDAYAVSQVVVSEADNLEGYLYCKLAGV